MSKKKVLIICGVISLLTTAVVYAIFSTEPTAKSEGATKISAMLVSVESVKKGNFTPNFIATGTVLPVEDINLSAQVGGQVIERSSEFAPGGLVKRGELLLKINPADYINQLELRKSELLQAETNLEIEMGRQNVAEQDLDLVGGNSLSEKQRALVLRQPQLDAVKAQIKSAKATENQAMLNLQRTSITAPFDAQVIAQNVTEGSLIGLNDNLGRLVGIDNYWVEVTLPVNKLKWLTFPVGKEEKGAEVEIQDKSAWGNDEYRTGYLYRQVGALDRQTRLARILINVPDPLGFKTENRELAKLIIGGFVEANIKGEVINDVIKLNRDYLRSNQTVWVMENKELSIRTVNIKLIDANYAYRAFS
jgi:RND family efflux transporter MFP subunit